MGCRDLIAWPEGILNLLEGVFVILGLVFLLVGRVHYIDRDNNLESSYWFFLLVLLFVLTLALLISYIFLNPLEQKKILLIFYLVVIVVNAATFIIGLYCFDNCSYKREGQENDNCKPREWRTEYEDGNGKKHKYPGGGQYDHYVNSDKTTFHNTAFLIITWICNLVSLVLYCVSAFLLV